MGVVKNPILLKLIGAQRYLIWNTPVKVFNHIRIAEFPKSGGTWLGLMLSDLTGYSFRRSTWMTFGKGIQHSHLPWTRNGGKTILLIRDGRDVVVSAYYHFLFAHEKNPLSLVNHWRSLMAKKE